MPSKSRRSRGKYPARGKRGKGARGSLPVTAAQPPVAQAQAPAPQSKVSVPSAKVPTPSVAAPVARYPYVAAELRRIGILAGVIVVILVVLAFVLPR
jgi:hypothetical protein